ncbi:MAG: hypothetical protein LAN59_13155 [Acidobacteriia bacterium]|nr:hypothetical protein [Terriglobia bacterium]
MNLNLSAYSAFAQPGYASAVPGTTSAISPGEQKLRHAAAEFEAMLLSKWWSAMKEGGFSGAGDESDPGHDTLDQLGMQAMSTAVAAGGGLGIGSLLVRSLLSNVRDAKPSATTLGAPAATRGGISP